MIQKCQDAKIAVKLVRMPEPLPLRRRYPPAVRNMVDTFYADLARATGVEIVDARDWLADDDFRDGFHLTPKGSIQFSLRLNQECLLPFLAGDASDGTVTVVAPTEDRGFWSH
jgi:hypothetical protein